VGTPVSQERVIEAFESDVKSVLRDAKRLYSNFASLPGEVQLIIANMLFNMGLPRLRKFVNMKKAVDREDWIGASEAMEDSKWHKQVTKRANRLIKRMKRVDLTA
jgi:adenylate cyclase